MNYRCVLSLTLIILAGCTADETLVTIGSTKYSRGDFTARVQFRPIEDSAKRMTRVDEFVNQMCVVEEAKSLGYADDPVVTTAFETGRKDVILRGYYEHEVINKIKIPDAEIRQIYEQIIDQYHLAQVVLASESVSTVVNADVKRGVPFESLLHYSLDTMTQGGDIGTFSAISLPPEILAPVKKAKIGSIVGPITFGDYIYFFKIIDHQKADEPKFADVKENIRTNLLQQKAMERAQAFTQELIAKAKIEYNQAGIDALIKPDSLLTPADLELWVVKKNDTSMVYVRSIRQAVYYQHQQSGIDPKRLIERELIPELIYDEAMRKHADKLPAVKERLEQNMTTLLYQKFYADSITERVVIDSTRVREYYAQHKAEYDGKTLQEAYTLVQAAIRDAMTDSLREQLYARLRQKHQPAVNERVLARILKEEK